MIKKVMMTALLTATMAVSMQAQDDGYGVDATTGATAQKAQDEAQEPKSDKEKAEKRINKFMDAVSRLHFGGYGEVALSRNFYSDSPYRYTSASSHADDPGHGRFDLPHVALNLGYDFGRGWKFYTEVEYEHGGTGTAVERERDEAGEWENETEKGGEVELEQFWIQKTFRQWANIRVGHMIVPVGLNNTHHEPMNFFTVYRPEGENTILPSTWHDTGIDFWGRYKKFRYEFQFIAGLDAKNFSANGWVHDGANSAFEFKVANKYGIVTRVDYYPIDGLRCGISGYYGRAMHNSYPNSEMEGEGKTYNDVTGRVYIGSFDFTFIKYNWIVRGQADYGYLSDADGVTDMKAVKGNNSPYTKSPVGKNAVAIGIEAGYDVFSFFKTAKCFRSVKGFRQKMYVFGRYDHNNSYIPTATQSTKDYYRRNVWSFGLNYVPVKQVVVKLDYTSRVLPAGYNTENSINLGIAFQGQFF